MAITVRVGEGVRVVPLQEWHFYWQKCKVWKRGCHFSVGLSLAMGRGIPPIG